MHGAHVEYQKLTTSGLPTRSAVGEVVAGECLDVDVGKRLAGHRGVGADRRGEVVARRQRDVVVRVDVVESSAGGDGADRDDDDGCDRQRAEQQPLVDRSRG